MNNVTLGEALQEVTVPIYNGLLDLAKFVSKVADKAEKSIVKAMEAVDSVEAKIIETLGLEFVEESGWEDYFPRTEPVEEPLREKQIAFIQRCMYMHYDVDAENAAEVFKRDSDEGVAFWHDTWVKFAKEKGWDDVFEDWQNEVQNKVTKAPVEPTYQDYLNDIITHREERNPTIKRVGSHWRTTTEDTMPLTTLKEFWDELPEEYKRCDK